MFAERLETLRERNKSLINQLRLQRETLERLSGFKESRKREREVEEEEEEEEERLTEEERRLPEELVTVIRGCRGPALEALAKPSVRFADVCEDQTDVQQSISVPPSSGKHRDGAAVDLKLSELLEARHGRPPGLSGPVDTKSCLVTRSEGRSGVQSRVRFQSDECEYVPVTDRHHSQPLLGYDWIAGVLDTDDSLMERSDDFFEDLRVFRSLNRDECVRTTHSEFSEDGLLGSPPPGDETRQANADTHQCTFSYRINNRLFPVPLRAQESCPVCKKHKSSHPHTTSEPALIRVSIPRSALLPPYKYKAHRRCSFDPSDSLGLPSHCLSGWSNTGQTTLPPPSSLDLQSSLNSKASGSIKELENLSEREMSGNRDQIAHVTRLARHNFQHFHAKRKPSST